MSAASQILLWAQRTVAKRGSPAYQMLEIRQDASIDEAQEAFHKIARLAHPDLHRNMLKPDELEMLTSAYAAVAGAYQTFRQQAVLASRQQAAENPAPAGATAPARPAPRPTQPPPTQPAAPVAATPSGPAPQAGAAASMSSKALVYYRKAELALIRGDLKGAMLQIKLAIATDPQSGFLRTALAEVDAAVKKG